MLRRLFTLPKAAPKGTAEEDVFALLAALPQFSIARAAQQPQPGDA
ncbi:hypothetical protein K3728_05200 [Rhodobacteraceae bacterium M385]|nr:hypothetical protein K3728_05200 [Rhodobacteraceae bacterium M385]